MTKEDQFLWIVQTTMLGNAVNLATIPETEKQFRDVISATGTLIVASEAVDVSQRIPDGMTSSEAAQEFCTFMLPNLREQEEKSQGDEMTVPAWFARA